MEFLALFYGIIPSNPSPHLGDAPIKAESRNPRRNERSKISVKTISQPKPTTGGCMVRSIQIARSESEKAEEDRDQATKEQR
jgi:hypothetical protein